MSEKFELQFGTHEEHMGTIQRARVNEIHSVWTGDLRRNPYLLENLQYCEHLKLIETSMQEGDQESYVEIKFLQEQSNDR